MKKLLILLTLCLVGVLVSVSSVSAADIYVNASAPAGGDGSITNPFQNISAGINLATDGDTVNIADGVYNGTGNRQITITKSMTINGQSQTGTIIDAEQSGRIFNIMSGITVTIQNLTLQNGQSSESGGATLYNQGDLTLNNVTFKDNNATGYSSGGAICNSGNLIVTGSTFTGNKAACGGAIYNAGTLTVTDSNFTGNNAIYQSGATYIGGGAIRNDGTLTVTDSTFTENTATNSNGGAIYNADHNVLTCTNCNFTENSADFGGAIWNYEGILTCANCNFTENSAYTGGAILNYGELNCTNCNFTENIANNYSGGAIYNAGGVLTCANCNFTENIANHDGGAIYNNNSELTCTNCNFTENTASYYGGAIYNYYYSVLTCTSCDFTENTASYGGAIFAEYESIINCNSCVFTINGAESSGGAICNIGDSELTCTSCDFTNNSADQNGGAIYSSYSHVTIIGSNLASNTAGRDGGAFKNYFGDFTMNFNRIVGNTAGRYGQDIYDENNEPTDDHNALYNWWGSNNGPAAGSIGFDQVDLVEYDPWLVMTYSADPTTIQQGETSTLTADFRYDSDGAFHDPSLGHLPDGLPVTFTTDLGNVGSKSVVTYTLNGVATATLRGDEAAGVATTTANLDDQTLTTPVTIRAAGGGDGDNSTVTAEAATVGMQETGAPLTGMVLAILMLLGGFIGTRKN